MADDAAAEEDASPVAFYARCVRCSFTDEIDGQDAALRVAESHKQEMGGGHVVELFRLEAAELDDGQ